MKTCNKCGESRIETDFSPNKYVKSGLQATCKPCKAQIERDRRASDNGVSYRSHRRETYNPETSRAQQRAKYLRHRDKYIQEAKSARHTDKGRARAKLQDAVHHGRIEKPSACPVCGGGGIIDGHHEDYSKPLDVIWLCRICHGKHRRKDDA